MATIHFDESFDGGAWPGVFGAKATAGDVWVGKSGLLGTLEAQVGLAHEGVGSARRLGEVVEALRTTPGFWSKSLAADALATAREVMRLHDQLRLSGWKGEGNSDRLTSLAAAFRNVSPCAADRLERLIAELPRFPELCSTRLFEPLDASPLRVRELLAALKAREVPPPPAPDYRALSARLQLVRPYGPVVAADVVAQALAATPNEPTLIIGADAVLDAALRRHGLPTTGASSEPHDNALGELLPLVIELGLQPANPARAMEFLTLPAGPIRPDVARRLVRALQKWPAVGSAEWHQQLADATKELPETERAKVLERLAAFLHAEVDGAHGYPVAQLEKRRAALMTWLQGRAAFEKSDGAARQLDAAIAQVAAFGALISTTGAEQLTTAQVRRYLEEAREAMPTPPRCAPQAGLFSVDAPGGVVGRADRIIWWNFTRSSFSAPRRLPLSHDELAALSSSGVHVTSPAEAALRLMTRARRPLQHAEGALWLVTPLHEESGEEATPHPLWDEVVGVLRDDARALVRTEPEVRTPAKRVKRTHLPMLSPRHEWKTNITFGRRKTESPSSIEHFLGCTLAWALRYVAHLREGTTASIDASYRMFGSLAHHVLLERTLKVQHASAEAAGRHAEETLLNEGPTLAAPLFQPGADADLISVRDAVRKAAEVLWQKIEEGWPVLGTEEAYDAPAFETDFAGQVDLVVGTKKRAAVIDLKWSGLAGRRQLVEDGAAIQLHSYAALLEEAGFKKPEVAYFIIQSQTWLSTSRHLVDDDTRVEARSSETWSLTQQAHADAWAHASRGELTAPGVRDDAHKRTRVEKGELQVKPPCGYCEFSGICGQRYGVLEVGNGEG